MNLYHEITYTEISISYIRPINLNTITHEHK